MWRSAPIAFVALFNCATPPDHICIANIYDEKGRARLSVSEEFRRSCGAWLGADTVTYESQSDQDWRGLTSTPVSTVRPFRFGYIGHGIKEDEIFRFPVGHKANVGLDTLAGRLSVAPYAVFLVAACDSGYAAVHHLDTPATLIAAGYGLIPTSTSSTGGENSFMAAFAEAVAGKADRTPLGNGDCMVTDAEAVRFMTSAIKRRGWNRGTQPAVVLRRQWWGEVPLARLPFEKCADSRPTIDDRSLDSELLKGLQFQRKVAEGLNPVWFKATARYLLLRKKDFPPDFIKHLAVEAKLRGYDLKDVSALDQRAAWHFARTIWFTPVVLLRQERDEYILSVPAEHVYLRSLMVSEHSHMLGVAKKLADHLPQNYTVRMVSEKTLQVTIDGVFKSDLLVQKKVGGGWKNAANLRRQNAQIAPCPEGRGQCFVVQADGKESDKWQIVEDTSSR